jgi:hypothetical protein
MPRYRIPVPTRGIAKAPRLTGADVPTVLRKKMVTVRLVSIAYVCNEVGGSKSKLLVPSQGGEDVDVVHVDRSIPIRCDTHVDLCSYIGYLALNWKGGRRQSWSKTYKNTISYVHDHLVQNFFPGPTWMAAGNPRGGTEPKPPFVQVRWEVIVGKY